MKLITGILDYRKPWSLPDFFIFTGNPVRKANGAIVMGRGAAKMVRDAYPGIDIRFGQAIAKQPSAKLIWLEIQPGQNIGWFKVKDHWKDEATLQLIADSALELHCAASMNPWRQYHMNYPGVGNGRLDEYDVQPILKLLPDNVHIYR